VLVPHPVSPWVFPATPNDRPRGAVSPIVFSSPLILAIPNFPTALLKTPCRRTHSCSRFDSDIDAGGAREEALSCLPGSLMQVSTRVTWNQLLWNIRTRQGHPMRLILQFSASASLSLCISFGTLSRTVLALRPPLACAG
jgi:hypothetical protein